MLTLSEAAEQLGISRAALDNWIKRLEIEKKKEGRIGLTAKEVEQIRKQRRSNSRRRDTNTTRTNSSEVVSAFVEQELKELKQVREQLQVLSEERLQWQKERLQYLEREASSRKELQSWEARFAETQRRADWLQEQLDSNSREKTELFKQADQFQQLLSQKERSLQKILEEKQELQQQLHLLEEQAISETSELETPPVDERTPSVEHEEELLSETEPAISLSTDASAAEEGEPESREELNDSEEIPESSVELEDDEADLMLFDELEDDEEVSNEFSIEEESIEVDIFEEMAPVEVESAQKSPAADSNDEEDGWNQEKKRQFSEFADLLDELEAQVARRYLGFGEDRQSLESIAFALSIPVSEVRQVAGRAVLKIRSYHLQLRQSGPSIDA
ncbi:MAG: hypothetical protein CL921_05375 [Deltaproteobacteria bacterium]|nr:hypothetical protein [Deltaproteobacteria bacterium]